MEKAEVDIMNKPPRESKEGIFSHGLGLNVSIQGIYLALITIVSYIIGEIIEIGSFTMITSEDGMTMSFLTLSLAEIFHSFNMRSMTKSIFKNNGHNYFLYGTLFGAFIMTILVIYVPFLRNAFGFAFISIGEFIISIAIALTVIPFVEMTKAIQRKVMNRKMK